MIKGTRFFSRRLLPLLLAAVMLLGMLPALTLPVLAEKPPASQKLTNTTDTELLIKVLLELDALHHWSSMVTQAITTTSILLLATTSLRKKMKRSR